MRVRPASSAPQPTQRQGRDRRCRVLRSAQGPRQPKSRVERRRTPALRRGRVWPSPTRYATAASRSRQRSAADATECGCQPTSAVAAEPAAGSHRGAHGRRDRPRTVDTAAENTASATAPAAHRRGAARGHRDRALPTGARSAPRQACHCVRRYGRPRSEACRHRVLPSLLPPSLSCLRRLRPAPACAARWAGGAAKNGNDLRERRDCTISAMATWIGQ